MDTALLLVGIIGLGFVFRFMARQNNEIIKLLKDSKEDIAPTQPTRSPNKLEKMDPDILFFDENNPLSIPKDVKFDIEGGDMTTPPEYTNAQT